MKIMSTMTQETIRYGRKAAEQREVLPAIDLTVVPHKGRALTVGVFGSNAYRDNVREMSKQYWHSSSMPRISFRPSPSTTSESISAAAYDFENEAKPKIFDPRWLQLGYIVRTQDGVFTNTQTTDEKSLKKLLNNVKKVNGIYLLDNEIGFAPYESFQKGVQDCDTFTHGGLARILEYSEGNVAENLRAIASPKFYKRGVNVWGFDEVKEPVLRVSALYSNWYFDDARLSVGGGLDEGRDGYAFGVSAPSAIVGLAKPMQNLS